MPREPKPENEINWLSVETELQTVEVLVQRLRLLIEGAQLELLYSADQSTIYGPQELIEGSMTITLNNLLNLISIPES
jgi:hypothetical protein